MAALIVAAAFAGLLLLWRARREPDDTGTAAGATPDLHPGALHQAVVNGMVDVVRANLGSPAVSSADVHGVTPLHRAAAFGHSEIAALLLPHSNISAPDSRGNTPRRVSAIAGHPEVEALVLAREVEFAHMPQRDELEGELSAVRGCAKQLKGLQARSPELRFFPATDERELPKLHFLRLSPDTPAPALARHGLHLVERFDEPDQPLPSPRVVLHDPPHSSRALACSSSPATGAPTTALRRRRTRMVGHERKRDTDLAPADPAIASAGKLRLAAALAAALAW